MSNNQLLADSVVFQGVVNGRPRFVIPKENTPPRWLVDLAGRAKVEGNAIRVGSTLVKPGESVRKP
jgi:hypothetical protein